MGKKITAREGYVFVCGEAFVTTIYLGDNDSIDNYPEITTEERDRIISEREAQAADVIF